MSLIQKVAQATPELISANEPSLISSVTTSVVPGYLGYAVFGIVAIMAAVAIWHTVKLYKPELLPL